MEVTSKEDAAAALADLALVTQHIFATRHVAEVSVAFSWHYSPRDVATALGPLLPRIRALLFLNFSFAPSEWQEMDALLRSVRVLRFVICELPTEMLTSFAGSVQLQELHLDHCVFVEDSVVAMAAVRNAPLSLSADPKLSPQVISRCRAAAERERGAQSITFM